MAGEKLAASHFSEVQYAFVRIIWLWRLECFAANGRAAETEGDLRGHPCSAPFPVSWRQLERLGLQQVFNAVALYDRIGFVVI